MCPLFCLLSTFACFPLSASGHTCAPRHQLRDKLGEKLSRLQRGDEASFDELFSFACPKFVTPAPPADSEAAQNNYNQVRQRGERGVEEEGGAVAG